MDFAWSVTDQQFRLELRSWMTENLAKRNMTSYQGVGKESLLSWEQALRNAKLNAVSWPVEYGGQGFDPLRALIFNAESEMARAPRRLNYPALGLLGPTVMAVGTAEQRATLLPRILDCSDIWCQGFSEPDAGSDLGSLRTKAQRSGDMWVLNGQKTWCSNGARATKMFALVRTEEGSTGSRGLSYMLVDLKLPGVEVRPIKQVNGGAAFAEVFLTDVEVPAECTVGDEGAGWQVARETLKIERGASRYAAEYFQRAVDEGQVIAEAKPGGLNLTDKVALARMQADVECWRVNTYSAVTDTVENLGPLNAVFKLNRSEMQQRIYEFGLRALGELGELGAAGLPEQVGPDFHERYWHSRASSIYAGTNEIQRTIIADRVLKLPREPRA